jgi:hypothetical protein
MLASSPAPRRARLAIWLVAEPIGFTAQPTADEPSTTGPTHASPAARTVRRADHTAEAPYETDASHELSVPFSACQPRCAIRGSQPPDDPASALLSSVRPARPHCRKLTSPLRFFAWRMGCGGTRSADGSVAVVAKDSSRGRDVSPDRNASRLVGGHPRGHFVGESDRRARERPVTSSATASLGIAGVNRRIRHGRPSKTRRPPTRSWIDRVADPGHPSPKPGHAPTRSLARCSATQRLELSRPG